MENGCLSVAFFLLWSSLSWSLSFSSVFVCSWVLFSRLWYHSWVMEWCIQWTSSFRLMLTVCQWWFRVLYVNTFVWFMGMLTQRMLSAHIVVTVVKLVGFEVNCSQTMNTELKFNCIWPRPKSHYVGCHKVGIFFLRNWMFLAIYQLWLSFSRCYHLENSSISILIWHLRKSDWSHSLFLN